MTEPVEHIEMSDQDEKDLDKLLTDGKPPEFHTVLEVWRQVLEPVEKFTSEKVTPQYATRIVSSYTGITFADMELVQSLYYGKVKELQDILEAEIAKDPDCLSYTTPEEDVRNNSNHYKRVIIDWQKLFLQWEMEWTCTEPAAPMEVAAISEAHKMFFSQTGLTAFLDNIKYVYSPADQQEQSDELNALREELLARDE